MLILVNYILICKKKGFDLVEMAPSWCELKLLLLTPRSSGSWIGFDLYFGFLLFTSDCLKKL